MKHASSSVRLLSLFAMTGALFLSPEAKAQDSKFGNFFTKRAQQIESLANDDNTDSSATTADSRVRKSAAQHSSGLGNSRLGTASLQTNTNLNSTARDKTSAGEWRQMFKKNKQ